MIIVLKPDATKEVVEELLATIEERGLKPLHMPGTERVVLGALGDERVLAELVLESHPQVESVKQSWRRTSWSAARFIRTTRCPIGNATSAVTASA